MAGGFVSIDVTGQPVRTSNERVALGAPRLPAASFASATAWCAPSPRADDVTDQAPAASACTPGSAAPSTATYTVANGSAVPVSAGVGVGTTAASSGVSMTG